MILYAITICLIICGFLAFKGVGEIYLLSSWGVDLLTHKRVNVNEPQNIDISSIDKSGHALASLDDAINPFKKLDKFLNIDVAEILIRFRGSKLHVLFIVSAPLALIVLCFLPVNNITGLVTFLFILICFGPSYFLYLTHFAWFYSASSYHGKSSFSELSGSLARVGETRLGTYRFQSNKFIYEIFSARPRVKKLANIVPLV